jgi:uncharacterized protein YtpQ (UPF0354 family)
MKLFDKLFGPPSKDKFAQLMMDAIQKAGETGEITYEQEEFRLRGEDENGSIIFLGNVYEEYCAAQAEQREKILKLCVRNWFGHLREMPEEFEDVKPDLLPVVRARSYFELTRLQMEVEGHEAAISPHEVLGEHFAVGLVYDLPDSMRSIPQQVLDGWGVSFYEALEAARQNLTELKHGFIGPESGQGVYLSASKDSYDASRLILTDLIRQFRVKGDPIAMIPNRDTLIVVGSEDEAGLTAMLSLAKEALKKPRPISGIALRLEGDEWTPWLPDPSHPQYAEFRQLQLQSRGQDYAEQKALLDKLHEKNGVDVFVASYSALQDKKGRVLSYAVWPEGPVALLPQTDLVAFMREGHDPVMADLDRVLTEVGHLMEPQEMYPPRYLVKEFPTEEELALIGRELK